MTLMDVITVKWLAPAVNVWTTTTCYQTDSASVATFKAVHLVLTTMSVKPVLTLQ